MRYMMVTFEAAYPLEETPNLARAIQSGLDGLRGEGAARAVDYKIFESDKEYEDWYNSNKRIQEALVPQPTTISWD